VRFGAPPELDLITLQRPRAMPLALEDEAA
jgi:hypothetical protein